MAGPWDNYAPESPLPPPSDPMWHVDPAVQADRDTQARLLRAQYDNNPAYEGPSTMKVEGDAMKVATGVNRPLPLAKGLDTQGPWTQYQSVGDPQGPWAQYQSQPTQLPSNPTDQFVANAKSLAKQHLGEAGSYLTSGIDDTDAAGSVIGTGLGAILGVPGMIGDFAQKADPVSMMRILRDYKKDHPDAGWMELWNHAVRAPGVTGEALEWLKSKMPESVQKGMEATGTAMNFPGEVSAKTVKDYGGSDVEQEFAGNVTNLATLLAPVPKSRFLHGKPKVPGKPSAEPFVGPEDVPNLSDRVDVTPLHTDAPRGLDTVQGQPELPLDDQMAHGEAALNRDLTQEIATHGNSGDLFDPQNSPKEQATPETPLPEIDKQPITESQFPKIEIPQEPPRQGDLLKRAEENHAWEQKSMDERAQRHMDVEKAWADHDALQEQMPTGDQLHQAHADIALENERSKQNYIDNKFEESRPTAMEAAFKDAGLKGPDSAGHFDSGLASTYFAKARQNRVKAGVLLDHVIETEKNPLIRQLAKILKKVAGDVDVVAHKGGLDSERQGYAKEGNYDPLNNVVQLHPEVGLNRGTLMHELVHAVASNFMRTNPTHPITKAINHLYEIARRIPEMKDEYAVSYGSKEAGPHEFLAEAMSRRDVQAKLAQHQLSDADRVLLKSYLKPTEGVLRTAWDAVKDTIGKVLGIKERSTLEYTLKAFTKLVDEAVPDAYGQAKYSDEIGSWRRRKAQGLAGQDLPVKNGDKNWYTKFIDGVYQPFSEFQKAYAPGTKDIVARLGGATASFRSSTPYIRALGTAREAAAATSLFFDNAIRHFRALEHNLNMQFHPLAADYNRHYGISRLLGPSDEQFARFQQDMGIRLDMERNTDWFDGKNYSPTKEQLMAKGMDEKSAALWERIGQADELAWKTETEGLRINGQKIPQRIPGWVRHEWKGPYKVRMLLNKADGSREPVIVETYNFWNKKEQAAGMAEMQKKVDAHPEHNLTLETEDPKAGDSGVQSMVNAMWEVTNKLENQKGLQALLEAVYKGSQKGMLQQLMDRASEPKGGYLLHRATKEINSTLGLSKTHMVEAMRTIQRNWEQANGFYVRARFVNEVLFPMKEAGYLKDLPNLEDAIKTYTGAFLKISDVMEAKVNNKIKDMLINMGQDPGLAGKLSNTAMDWASKYYLVGNPAFYAVNFFQAAIGASGLLLMRAIPELTGGQRFSVIKALSESKGDLRAAATLDTKNPLIKYAVENGHSDPVFMESIDPGKIRDVVSIGLERRTRTNAFVTGYHAFKQIMGHEDALKAAGAYADMIGVPYNKQFGAPTWLGQMSVLERPLLMFTTFTQHMFGMLNQQLRVGTKAVSMGEYKAATTALQSFGALMAVQYALFGITGLPLMNNWDSVVKNLNKAFPETFDLPTHVELARNIDEHMPDWAKGISSYGQVSKMIGYDVSPSGSGPNIQAPAAMFDALKTFVQLSILGGRAAFSDKPVTKQEVWEEVRGMPAKISGPLEFMIKGNLIDYATGAATDYSPTKNIAVERGIERTYGETLMRIATGLRSIDEKDFNASYEITERQTKNLDDWIGALSQKFKETGQMTSDDINTLIKLSLATGTNIGPVIDAMVKAQMTKRLSPDAREAMDLKSLKSIMDFNRLNTQRNRELDRRR